MDPNMGIVQGCCVWLDGARAVLLICVGDFELCILKKDDAFWGARGDNVTKTRFGISIFSAPSHQVSSTKHMCPWALPTRCAVRRQTREDF